MRSGCVTCLGTRGFHRMHYVEWGDPGAGRVVICAHGLTRNGRDFDTLAQALPEFRVISPDIVGRGRSDWLPAKDEYAYPQYCADMAVLIARATAGDGEPKHVYWVGTSMGGIIGMLLAASPGTPVEKLVVNDVGPHIPGAALERIAAYVGKDPRFKSYRELEAYVRMVCAPFGKLTDAQWRQLTEHGAKQHEDGAWGMRYDPDIRIPFRKGPIVDVDLWQYYDAIRCPTLLLRGALSDLLLEETAARMTQRGPRPRLVEFEGIGHAPMFMAADQINAVREFLLGD